MAAIRRATTGATLALAFLTILPVRPRGNAATIGAAAAWFPAVGALVGLVAGGAWVAAEPTLGAAVAGVVAVIVIVVLTGALHQDGLADCADGLGVRGDRAHRLAVMRDPSIGAFGTIALITWALLFATALGALPPGHAIPTLVLAAALGRWGAVLHGTFAAPARREGLGASFRVGPAAAVVATVSVTGAAVALDPASGLAALAAGGLATLATTAWARRAIGGRTGDTLGATVAIVELTACLILVGFARHSG
jgi:adenosylcobinamide-GDP ribazoletransferase